MQRHARDGWVAWIGLRPARRAPVVPVQAADITAAGLDGDHASSAGRSGTRAVTLFQAEHLKAIGAFLGHGALDPALVRRNVVVAGLNLSALKGRAVRLGGAVVVPQAPCHPCSRMEASLGPGGHSAMRGHGGWYAAVIAAGPLVVGDPVMPVPAA